MIRTLRLAAASFLVLAQMLSSALAGSGDDARAVAMVRDMLTDVYTVNRTKGTAHLPEAIMPYFDFDWWSRTLLGSRAEGFTPEQLAKVREQMPRYIAHLYRKRFSDGLNSLPTVHGSRPVKRSEMVKTTFYTSRLDLDVEWRVADRGQQMQVYDVMVGGVSFILLTRDEFGAIIDRSGPQGLIDYLENLAL